MGAKTPLFGRRAPAVTSSRLRRSLLPIFLAWVVERYRISNVVALRALIRHIMRAPATRFSVNKFYHALRSQQGHAVVERAQAVG